MKSRCSFVRCSLLPALSFIFSSFLVSSAASATPETTCYEFEISDSPERTQNSEKPGLEVWCYQPLQNPENGSFIFNADHSEARPELALVVEPDGTLTHGSLVAGKLSVHRVHSSQFNPFSVPLEEPDQATARSVPLDPSLENSAQKVLEFLRTHASEVADLRIQTGNYQAQVPNSSRPWRGFWWPYKNQPLSGGKNSPLAKFDRYVKARTNANPGAQAWENKNHRYEGISWEGHCNGWAASAIIRPEPRYPRRDPKTGVIFSVADQKGLLAEKDYCVKTAFFGKRYRGRPGDDLKDIYPIDFHQTLNYYIKTLGKPIAIDHHTRESVDNHIISGYKMNIKKTGSRTYSVSTTVTIHKYDSSSKHPPAVAPSYKKTYNYTLQTDANGNLVGGTWKTAGNPDFLWVPLSPSTCKSNNPAVTDQWVNEITNLPKAN